MDDVDDTFTCLYFRSFICWSWLFVSWLWICLWLTGACRQFSTEDHHVSTCLLAYLQLYLGFSVRLVPWHCGLRKWKVISCKSHDAQASLLEELLVCAPPPCNVCMSVLSLATHWHSLSVSPSVCLLLLRVTRKVGEFVLSGNWSSIVNVTFVWLSSHIGRSVNFWCDRALSSLQYYSFFVAS